jgi:hypothetical protein
MQTRLIIGISIGLVIILAVTLMFWPSRKSPVEGLYAFRSSELEETLELKTSGDFIQQIKLNGTNYNAAGHWSLDSHSLEFRGSFFIRFDGSTGKTLNPPLEVSLCPAYWDPWHERISFSADYDKEYFVQRVK